jgi:hypothetical protein
MVLNVWYVRVPSCGVERVEDCEKAEEEVVVVVGNKEPKVRVGSCC